MLRAGFIINSSNAVWNGGINYYRNLFNAICELPNAGISPVVITGMRINPSIFDGYPDIEIIRTPIFERYYPSWFFQRAFNKFTSFDLLLERFLCKNKIDLLSHSKYALNASSQIPWSTWIPDFQPIILPDLFSKEEITLRTEEFNNLGARSTRIILSSYDAQKDLEKYAPEMKNKSRVLQFVSHPDYKKLNINLNDLKLKYKFISPYFLIPNQFWIHKNHKVLVEALGILKAKKQCVLLLLTGKANDTRHPYYFKQLMQTVKDTGVSEYFRVLGEIPYSELTCLMVNSISMINPSFFEGWSTSVEEAKSLGKQILLSDIPVHREQAPIDGVYFDPRNPEVLADILWNRAATYDLNDDVRRMTHAKQEFPGRWKNFGRSFCDIATELVEG